MSLVLLHSFSYTDSQTLCMAAGSLKRLKLKVLQQSIFEALAEVFNHNSLEELDLTLGSDSKVD